MPVPKETPATAFADKLMEYLSPLIAEATEARLWHTGRDRRLYFEGYADATSACRDAVIRAAEDSTFSDLIETGEMPRWRTPSKK